jgi:hypothetical protein
MSAFEEGQIAYGNGVDVRANPHLAGSDEATDWWEGWQSAKYLESIT